MLRNRSGNSSIGCGKVSTFTGLSGKFRVLGELMSLPYFYIIPIWIVALTFFALLYGCLEISYRVGIRKLSSGRGRKQDSRGDTVLAAMLAMLGLMLAFTYSFTVARSDNRKAAMLAELNALGTAFARADLLEEPYRSKLKGLLLDFTRAIQIDDEKFRYSNEISDALDQMSKAQLPIWPATREMVKANGSMGPQQVSMVHAINEVMDTHTARIQAVFDRLPTAIHLMLLFIACASLSVAGYSAGRADSLRRWRMSALILVISVIMIVIIDFDRPGSGFVTTNLEGFRQLVSEMERDSSP